LRRAPHELRVHHQCADRHQAKSFAKPSCLHDRRSRPPNLGPLRYGAASRSGINGIYRINH
jgi:hypothetical protein